MFDAEQYINKLWPLVEGEADAFNCLTAKKRRAKVKKALAKWPGLPVTVEDHRAAEAEARRILDNRINNPEEDTPELAEVDGDAINSTYEIRRWAADVLLDASVWEYVAQDLLDFEQDLLDEQIKADHEHAERTKVVKAFVNKQRSKKAA